MYLDTDIKRSVWIAFPSGKFSCLLFVWCLFPEISWFQNRGTSRLSSLSLFSLKVLPYSLVFQLVHFPLFKAAKQSPWIYSFLDFAKSEFELLNFSSNECVQWIQDFVERAKRKI